MKKPIRPRGTIIGIAPAGGIKAGQSVALGSVFGVALHNQEGFSPVEIAIAGEVSLPKGAATVRVRLAGAGL